MGAFSSSLTTTARQLLTNFGQVCTLTSATTGTFDPASGSVNGSSDTTTSGVCYPSAFNLAQIDGTTIKQDDTLLIVSIAVAPSAEDLIEFGGKSYTVLNIQKITAQGSAIIYKLQVRQ